MMRVITCNVNGIRSAHKKGFFDWLAQQSADVVCLQETRANMSQLDAAEFCPPGMHCVYNSAQKKGYSGVAIFSKTKPISTITNLDFPLSDEEGRFLAFKWPKLTVASIYFPSGTSGDERQSQKYLFLDQMERLFGEFASQGRSAILCGDYNIAHTTKDIKNWRSNQKNSGFLPEERAWMDKLLDTMSFNDAFREVDDRDEQYTWWSNRGRAWENNTGWRIDYQVTTPDLKGLTKQAQIYKEQRFSDHAPLIVDYDLELA